jgi:hypothetical protein
MHGHDAEARDSAFAQEHRVAALSAQDKYLLQSVTHGKILRRRLHGGAPTEQPDGSKRRCPIAVAPAQRFGNIYASHGTDCARHEKAAV